MANPFFDSIPKTPLTLDDLDDDSNVLPIPQDTLQLQLDTLNVVEDRVPLSNFSAERQQQIMHYYQFSADFQNSKYPKVAKRTFDTLDII